MCACMLTPRHTYSLGATLLKPSLKSYSCWVSSIEAAALPEAGGSQHSAICSADREPGRMIYLRERMPRIPEE